MSDQHKIEIFQSDAPVHGWTLRIGDRYQDHLTFCEMLEILIEHTRDGAISFPEKPHYGGLMTTEEHAQRFRAYAGLPDDGGPRLMGYYTRYTLDIQPRPDLERIGSLGRARRALDREGLQQTPEIAAFFAEPINEAIYQALFNEQLVYALGRSLLGGGEPDSQWRTQDDDLLKLSAAAPDHLFILSGRGEEAGDQWRKYFKGGRMYKERAATGLDEFDESKLA